MWGKTGVIKMFILKIEVKHLAALIKTSVNLYALSGYLLKALRFAGKFHVPKHDEFVATQADGSQSGSTSESNEDLLLLLRFAQGDDSSKPFNDFVTGLDRGYKALSAGNLLPDIAPEIYVRYFNRINHVLKDLASKEIEGSKENKMRREALSVLASTIASHPRSQIAKLISIAKNSNYPQDVRAIAGSLASDAISHLKLQHVDYKSARLLVALVSSVPDDVRSNLGSSLDDARIIEESSKQKDRRDQDRFALDTYDSRLSLLNPRGKRSLTFA